MHRLWRGTHRLLLINVALAVVLVVVMAWSNPLSFLVTLLKLTLTSLGAVAFGLFIMLGSYVRSSLFYINLLGRVINGAVYTALACAVALEIIDHTHVYSASIVIVGWIIGGMGILLVRILQFMLTGR